MKALASVPRDLTDPPKDAELREAFALVEKAIAGSRVEDLPGFLGQAGWICGLVLVRQARLTAPASAAGGPIDLIEAEEAAKRLKRSTDWLYRKRSKLSFALEMPGGGWLYSSQGIDEWIRKELRKRAS